MPGIQGKKFFDYDEIDYYFNDYDAAKLSDLYDNQSRSELDCLKTEIVIGDIPKDITDLSFIDHLEKIGYKKSRVEQSKFSDIDKIFFEKTAKESLVTACVHVYRDILIFRKNNKVVGTAKICFDCMAHQITGTKANTEDFGQDGDYGKLEMILKR